MRARFTGSLCVLLGACTVTNTGNPSHGSGGHPEGIELVRSSLARDETPDVTGAELASFGSDQRAFAFDLYGQLRGGEPNLFVSPYSIATALAMTYAGAAGTTKQEMAAALHFALPEPALHAAFNAVDHALEARAQDIGETEQGTRPEGDGFELDTNNALFAQRGQQVHSEFLDVLARNYGSGVFLADFQSDAERERVAINRWVYDQTETRIEELLPEMSLTSDTMFVLVNTIYFKGSWLSKFDPAKTEAASFHADSGDVQVQMMHQTSRGQYARGSGYQAVELPYLSDSVRMLLVLPDEGQLGAVEGRIASVFDEARGALGERLVDLRLPRFSFRASFELKPVLQALGMRSAFADADLSGIARPPGDLYIDEVYHQAFVAVDEKGTEAAAATAVVITRESAPEQVAISFERPFLFFVHDEPTGQILFAGRLGEP